MGPGGGATEPRIPGSITSNKAGKILANGSSRSHRTSGVARRSADLRLAWLDAADDVHEAYLVWRDAEREEQDEAFAVYQAALDREEAAAHSLQLELSGRAERF